MQASHQHQQRVDYAAIELVNQAPQVGELLR